MVTEVDTSLIWAPLPEAYSQPGIFPVQWIVHTAVDGPGDTDLRAYFARTDINLESSTYLSWRAHAQLVPFLRSADANYKANRYLKGGRWVGAVSTETEDDGSPVTRPWNDYQLGELIRFGVWLNRTYGIPPRLPRTWDDPGMGYHSLFPMVWTNVRGKTCPGATRIRQWITVVLPGIQAVLAGGDDLSMANIADILSMLNMINMRVTAIQTAVTTNADIGQDVQDLHNEFLNKDDDPNTTDRYNVFLDTFNEPGMIRNIQAEQKIQRAALAAIADKVGADVDLGDEPPDPT